MKPEKSVNFFLMVVFLVEFLKLLKISKFQESIQVMNFQGTFQKLLEIIAGNISRQNVDRIPKMLEEIRICDTCSNS